MDENKSHKNENFATNFFQKMQNETKKFFGEETKLLKKIYINLFNLPIYNLICDFIVLRMEHTLPRQELLRFFSSSQL
jgi:hypothetical protein